MKKEGRREAQTAQSVKTSHQGEGHLGPFAHEEKKSRRRKTKTDYAVLANPKGGLQEEEKKGGET